MFAVSIWPREEDHFKWSFTEVLQPRFDSFQAGGNDDVIWDTHLWQIGTCMSRDASGARSTKQEKCSLYTWRLPEMHSVSTLLLQESAQPKRNSRREQHRRVRCTRTSGFLHSDYQSSPYGEVTPAVISVEAGLQSFSDSH